VLLPCLPARHDQRKIPVSWPSGEAKLRKSFNSGSNPLETSKLTIKGNTKDIEFPATVKQEGKKLTASAKIKVNRTHYDIRYGSKSFFDNLGDKAIGDEFELDLKLVAN
jgi:hypothetical protein